MQKVSIEYSIVSRGTEKYNNCGYMAISKIYNLSRYILNVDHNVKDTNLNANCLIAKSYYDIENIVFSRFQLITALTFERIKYRINDNILILGLGNIGISCLFYLLDNNFKNITIYVRNKNDKILNLLKLVKMEYNVDIKIISNFNYKYDTYIDTTGDSIVLSNVFNNSNFNSTIIILSTPRDEKYLISPLMINRKNLTVIGGHELNGINVNLRQYIFEKVLEVNKTKKFLKEFINEHNYSEEKLKNIKRQKSNFIEIFKY